MLWNCIFINMKVVKYPYKLNEKEITQRLYRKYICLCLMSWSHSIHFCVFSFLFSAPYPHHIDAYTHTHTHTHTHTELSCQPREGLRGPSYHVTASRYVAESHNALYVT